MVSEERQGLKKKKKLCGSSGVFHTSDKAEVKFFKILTLDIL